MSVVISSIPTSISRGMPGIRSTATGSNGGRSAPWARPRALASPKATALIAVRIPQMVNASPIPPM